MRKFLILGLSLFFIGFSCLGYAQLSEEELDNVRASLADILTQLQEEEITQDGALGALGALYTQEILPNLELPQGVNAQDVNFDSLMPAILDILPTANNDYNTALNALLLTLGNPFEGVSAGPSMSTAEALAERVKAEGGRFDDNGNSVHVSGWNGANKGKGLSEDLKKDIEKYAEKKGKKISKSSPTVTGKLTQENGEYSFNVYVWTGVGDPDNIHVDKEYWNSLDDSQKVEIESQAKEYSGKVIIEDEPTQIELSMHLTPVEGAPRDDYLSDKDFAFLEDHVGDEITIHGWTDDGLINSEGKDGEKDTLQVVGLGTWDYEPQHPFDSVVLEEEYSFDNKGKTAENKKNLLENTIIASGYEVFYPCLDRK